MSGPLRSERKVVGFVRDPLPKVGSLSLKSEHAQADLEHLGWRNVESLDLLWGLSGAGDPDVALNLLIRLYQALEAIGEDARNELDQEIRQDEELRVRLFALLGGSSAVGDHLVANPLQWKLLKLDAPSREEMFQALLESVKAQPAVLEVWIVRCVGRVRPHRFGRAKTGSSRGCYRAKIMFIMCHCRNTASPSWGF